MRVIEADKVIPLMRLLLLFNPKADEICENMQEVIDIHTIDAVPVLHGRWEDAGHGLVYKCSECGHLEDMFLSNYCPNCGAYMRGD